MPFESPHTPQSPSTISDLPQKPITSPTVSHSLPTPAHSINGSMSSLGSGFPLDAATLDESSNKRKRDVDDLGEDRDLKKVHIEDSRLSIEDLHIDVGKKYLLCRTPHTKPAVDVSIDLFDRYNLTGIAKSVARKDPADPNSTGVTIRKSYKSIFKKLAGNFDVEKKAVDAPDTLYAMMAAPTEEWEAHYRSNEISKGLSDATLTDMGKAFEMAKGPIPKSEWNSAVLGEVVAPSVPLKPIAKPMSNIGSKPTNPQLTSTHTLKEIPRPKRNVKKRAYGDSSYEGYGEGYVDDEVQDTGYSTGDNDDRRKRPKKTITSSGNLPQGPMRQNSYGPGMVGA